MHLMAHSISTVPFLMLGSPEGALGAIFPDLAWIHAEIMYRLSGEKNWKRWAEKAVTPLVVLPYRLTHSALVVVPVCVWFDAYEFLLGWTVHILMDLPTHSGVMTQQPLYPIKWKWKWILPSYS